LCKFSSFAPVQAAVEAPPAPSRQHVVGKFADTPNKSGVADSRESGGKNKK